MAKIGKLYLGSGFNRLHVVIAVIAVAASCVPAAYAQTTAQAKIDGPAYARKNTFGFLVAYSPDSSHILLGIAENRKLVNLGVSYSRRLFLNHIVNWQYNAELLPVILESDPVQFSTLSYTLPGEPPINSTTTMPTVLACGPSSGSGTFPGGITYTYVNTCGRRWTIGEAMSPVGFQWNFLPAHRMQPFVVGHGGYMYSSQTIPTQNAGSFNFTFDLGAGFEIYRTRTQSFRAEFRYHHFSNDNTARENPGVDNGLIQVSYCFGR